MLRRVARPVRLDRFPVTVRRYKQFLHAAARHGSAQWDHPDMPGGHAHQPCQDRLPAPAYYEEGPRV